MYTPYVRITTGNIFTQLDSAAKNPLGCIYSPPASQAGPTTAKGYGAQPVLKYVYYNSTTNPAPVAAPAPVYYTDESFTTVSGNAAEAFVTTGGLYIAGYWLPNTTSIASLANNTTGTNTQVNQSYGWIQIGGLLVGAWGPTASGAVGAAITGLTTGNWASTGAANAQRQLGYQLTAVASSVCDVLVSGDVFWGS